MNLRVISTVARRNTRREHRDFRPLAQTLPQIAHVKQGTWKAATAQTLALRAATGKAFTIFFAGLAFTMTTLPKISFFPAFVAGFILVLILHKPGSVKIPVLDTSFVAMSARLPMSFAHTDFLSSLSVASASASAPLVMALAVVIDFVGAISCALEKALPNEGWTPL